MVLEGNIFFFDWEPALIQFLQQNMGSAGEFLTEFFSAIGGDTVNVLFLIFLYWSVSKTLARRIGEGLILTISLFPLFKSLTLRLRPYMVHEGVRCLQPPSGSVDPMDIAAQGYSFPSGHSASSVAVYIPLSTATRKHPLRMLCFFMPLFIGISRFSAGVHYPSDVLAGWLLGLLGIMIPCLLQHYVKREFIRSLIYLLLVLPGVFFCRSNDYYTSLGTLVGFSAASLFEQKYVRFEMPRRLLFRLLRLLTGLVIYGGLTVLLKLLLQPLSSVSEAASFLCRSLRYAICVFMMCGVYPFVFSPCECFLTRYFHLNR